MGRALINSSIDHPQVDHHIKIRKKFLICLVLLEVNHVSANSTFLRRKPETKESDHVAIEDDLEDF
jgi:hypothetical protein